MNRLLKNTLDIIDFLHTQADAHTLPLSLGPEEVVHASRYVMRKVAEINIPQHQLTRPSMPILVFDMKIVAS